MCDSRRPLEGADSAPLIFEPKSEPVDPTIARDQAVAYMIEEWLPEATRTAPRRDRPRWMDRDLSRDETGREPF